MYDAGNSNRKLNQREKRYQNNILGEQRDRGYDWKVDPKNHRFGKENPQITKEMNHVLQPEFTQDTLH